ncbi:MAG: RsmF rRNA methyltransferase first C-terminal domain-containing protein [Streptococcaceae bacterium]|nr:RsmF rRNA methyltransferase first C-terminal domain-containing protein [Streptococcaceae bacterium]
MDLPVEFLDKYKNILGNDFEAFLKSFDREAVSAFRINPLKNLSSIESRDYEAISESSFGYYGKVSGKSVEHVCGLVYSQEPAAQVVAESAGIQPGMKVLDLCAAPGGKSTHLLSFLGNEGLLVSNEISHKRSKILVENIERFGARNVVVLNESPKRLAKVFTQYFDAIILDAPCSGEGMFRKDSDAIQYWSSDYPQKCANLQREIVGEAMQMLAPGGSLIYSTCTWSEEENEDIVRWVLENYPTMTLTNIPKINGQSEGIDMPEVVRCWPHHFLGEGQFVAKFNDRRDKVTDKKVKVGKSKLTNEQKKLWDEFYKKSLLTDFLSAGILQVFGDNLYFLPEVLPDLSKLKIARNGLHLGVFKKNRFEPSFALGLALRPEEVVRTLEINEEQFRKYVAGETLAINETISNGWVQLVINGNGLGFAKFVNGVVKNYFPKGLRFSY